MIGRWNGGTLRRALGAVGLVLFSAALGGADPAPQVAGARGPVTNLPIPRYVSLKAAEGNVRRGPSLTHRIDWVYKWRNMPLQVVDEFGHWRRVRDKDGAGGWMHYSLLSGTRTVIVEQDMLELHLRPDAASQVVARAEAGAIARLGACGPRWCRLTADGVKGWAPKEALWGVDPDEIRD
ncbi:SH3-like domain-containing protein [Meinhardsimonia xiamenensis]|uniref:SH3-like domain-containing protein n=1 Tax=Meinhardsimonia xiamenensis TaxID=990712 RepID=A0A1G8YN01_9RHOB|nr:SH3 domain-containing protein [Meinhardsimonia xiamenensis]PRX37365.1 SH3-like domain-containing protein [Meinhardsimonia xiamenensis]SDK04116.1 SH3-like domain-containing protein [Meinhardsimonia xiamenensis]